MAHAGAWRSVGRSTGGNGQAAPHEARRLESTTWPGSSQVFVRRHPARCARWRSASLPASRHARHSRRSRQLEQRLPSRASRLRPQPTTPPRRLHRVPVSLERRPRRPTGGMSTFSATSSGADTRLPGTSAAPTHNCRPACGASRSRPHRRTPTAKPPSAPSFARSTRMPRACECGSIAARRSRTWRSGTGRRATGSRSGESSIGATRHRTTPAAPSSCCGGATMGGMS